jgi:hypothetical protein
MAFDINYFLKINNTYGTSSKKDTMLYDIKSQVNNRFNDTIDFYTVKVNENKQDLLIVRTIDENKKTIKARPDEDFNIGDYIFWNDLNWFVISKDTGNQVYTSGKMQLCNYTLKWQNSAGTILSYPCIASTSSTAGISEGKVITVGDSIYTIKLPFDSNTVLIDYDDRFFIDDLNVEIPQVYAVSKPNRTEFKFGDKGLIELTMKQSKYNDKTDRKDLGICNYIEPTENPNPPDGDTYAVIASDSEDNKVIVGYKDGTTLSPKFYNADKTENSSIVSVWEFALPAGLEGYIHLNYTGNNVNIYADDKFELYGTTIIASVSNGTGNYKGNITLTLGGWY